MKRTVRARFSHCLRPIHVVVLATLLVALACSAADLSSTGAATQQTAAAQQPLRALFIGNSYTYYNNLPGMVQELAGAGGRQPLEAHMVAYGGATLEVHWTQGEGPGRIRNEEWDYVVLQEQSTRPFEDREAFFRYARLFDTEIRRRGAVTVFYMTWARQNDPGRQAALTSAYETIARELGATVAPVGRGWEAALRDATDLNLFDDDGSHPNPTGSYLAACVFYGTLLGDDPAGLPGRVSDPESRTELVSLSDDAAVRLQAIAWSALAQ